MGRFSGMARPRGARALTASRRSDTPAARMADITYNVRCQHSACVATDAQPPRELMHGLRLRPDRARRRLRRRGGVAARGVARRQGGHRRGRPRRRHLRAARLRAEEAADVRRPVRRRDGRGRRLWLAAAARRAASTWPRWQAAKTAETARLEGVYREMLAQGGVELVAGQARFVDAARDRGRAGSASAHGTSSSPPAHRRCATALPASPRARPRTTCST